MQTRSQSKKQNLEFSIDFDEASKAWKQNKVSVGNGCYKYLCQKHCLKKPRFPPFNISNADYLYSHEP